MKNFFRNLISKVSNIYYSVKDTIVEWWHNRVGSALEWYGEENREKTEEELLSELDQLAEIIGFSYTAERSEAISNDASEASDLSDANYVASRIDSLLDLWEGPAPDTLM